MPRRPRIYVDAVAPHVVQRGHNRGACFFDDRERQANHGWLREAVQRERSHLHAYVSMTIHVHLLLTAQPVSVSDCEWGAFACQACHSCSDPRSLRRKLNC